MGDEVAGNVVSADRYELARIRSDGNTVLKPEGPRTPLGVFLVFVLSHKRKRKSVQSVLSVFSPTHTQKQHQNRDKP